MRAAATVMLTAPNGELVIVRPGEEFPEWAEVTNPHAIAEGDDEADTDTDTDTGGEADTDTDKDETAAKPAPAKRTARAAKTASDD